MHVQEKIPEDLHGGKNSLWQSPVCMLERDYCAISKWSFCSHVWHVRVNMRTPCMKCYRGTPPWDSINHLFWSNLLFMLFMINFSCRQLSSLGLSLPSLSCRPCLVLFLISIFLFDVNCINNKTPSWEQVKNVHLYFVY